MEACLSTSAGGSREDPAAALEEAFMIHRRRLLPVLAVLWVWAVLLAYLLIRFGDA